jgi:hypothetical protein
MVPEYTTERNKSQASFISFLKKKIHKNYNSTICANRIYQCIMLLPNVKENLQNSVICFLSVKFPLNIPAFLIYINQFLSLAAWAVMGCFVCLFVFRIVNPFFW